MKPVTSWCPTLPRSPFPQTPLPAYGSAVLSVRDGSGCSGGGLRGGVEDGRLARHDGVGDGSQAWPFPFSEGAAVDAARRLLLLRIS